MKGCTMTYEQATMIYGVAGFSRRGNRLTPKLKVLDLFMEHYEREPREFILTEETLYESIHVVTKTIHGSAETSFQEDLSYVFADPKEAFVLDTLKTRLFANPFVPLVLWFLEKGSAS